MSAGITDIASQLAARIPTGAESPERATADWRETLYNARATASVRPLTDLIRRSAPGDEQVEALCERLSDRRR